MFRRLRSDNARSDPPEAWEPIGEIAVDSGMVWIGDPVYGLVPSSKEAATDWQPFVDKAIEAGFTENGYAPYERRENTGSLGLAIQAGGSTGIFPVAVRRDPETGLVVELRIGFE